MTAAIVLAVVLVIAVAGISVAMQSQGSIQAPRAAGPSRRPRERRPPPSPEPVKPDPQPAETKGPELLRRGTAAAAKVVAVVDERTIGPVTRSRLTLEVEPPDGPPFEVTIRMAFPTPEARSRVSPGATVPVRYDPEDHNRVILDLKEG